MSNADHCGEPMVGHDRVSPSTWVFECEQVGILVISKIFGVASPVCHGFQRGIGIVLRHVVLELVAKTPGRRAVRRPLVENTADMGGKRHIGGEMLLEQALAFVDIAVEEAQARCRQSNVATFQIGKA